MLDTNAFNFYLFFGLTSFWVGHLWSLTSLLNANPFKLFCRTCIWLFSPIVSWLLGVIFVRLYTNCFFLISLPLLKTCFTKIRIKNTAGEIVKTIKSLAETSYMHIIKTLIKTHNNEIIRNTSSNKVKQSNYPRKEKYPMKVTWNKTEIGK